MSHEKISDLIQKFEVFSTTEHSIQVCREQQFRALIGALGNFFIGERVFKVTLQLSLENEQAVLNQQRRLVRGSTKEMPKRGLTREIPIRGRRNDPPLLQMWRGDLINTEQHKDYQRNYIVAEDYIIYMDMVYNGTQEDKNKISFMMVDVLGEGKVFFEDYRNFWIKFLEMYGELLQMKTIYNEETEFITKDYFSKIVKVNGEPKKDPSK